MEFGLADANHIFVEDLDQDSKTMCKDDLSQQLASGSKYVYDENMDPIVEPDVDLSYALSVQEVMDIQSVVKVIAELVLEDVLTKEGERPWDLLQFQRFTRLLVQDQDAS
jgi:fructose-bisphosphate aldolase class 1